MFIIYIIKYYSEDVQKIISLAQINKLRTTGKWKDNLEREVINVSYKI